MAGFKGRISALEQRIENLDKLDEIKFFDKDGNRILWLLDPETEDVKAFLIESWRKEIETLKRLERVFENVGDHATDRQA